MMMIFLNFLNDPLKPEIPEEMKNMRSRQVGTAMFSYDAPLTVAFYKPKPSKMVYVMKNEI